MRAEIKYLHSPDVYDLDVWDPPDRTDAGTFIQVVAGPRGEPGEESFDLTVGTPSYLAEHGYPEDPYVIEVDRWDFPHIRDVLTAAFEEPEADTWAELGEILGRVGSWEFDHYQPYDPDARRY